MHSQINFAYPWIVNYGHLIPAVLASAVFLASWMRKRNKWILGVSGAVALWALTAFILVRFGFDMNGRAPMPTQAFLASGSGRVLDMGAGTGRSSLMVLEARPNTTLVALDLFGESYTQHFGNTAGGQSVADQGRARLMANLKAAGVDQRVTIQPGDMRHLPLPDSSFDAIVSSYAIDHLGRQGIGLAMREANRVLKPGGEFLLMVVASDFWLKYTFGPMFLHARMPDSVFWEQREREAGFQIVESGHHPATIYIVSRKPPA